MNRRTFLGTVLAVVVAPLAPTTLRRYRRQRWQYFDSKLIELVRRRLPTLIAYDVCGVQPVTGQGLTIEELHASSAPRVAFRIKSRFVGSDQVI